MGNEDIKPKVIAVEDGEPVLKPLETVVPIEDPTKIKVVQPIQNLQPSQPMAATTTEQQDITKAGQRKINLIWETTQSHIAKAAIAGWLILNFIVVCSLLFSNKDINATKMAVIAAALSSISLTVGIIIGFYFSRTNHSAIGGVGIKEQPSDKGTR